jgi:hypothetical protein
MQIFVYCLDGKTLELVAEATDPIGKVKKMIQDKYFISMNRQCLVFGEETLDNDRMLSDYNINSQSKISLIMKPFEVSFTEAEAAYADLAENDNGEEEAWYSQEFDVEEPWEIEIENLEECTYKFQRILGRYFDERRLEDSLEEERLKAEDNNNDDKEDSEGA